MTCHEARELLLELDPRAEAHAADCPDCAAWLRTQQTIRGEMRRLAQSMDGPRPEVEAAILARYRNRKPAAGRAPWAWAAAAALAAGIALGAWFGSDSPPVPLAATSPAGEPGEFVLLDYGRPTPALTSGRLVRVTLPPGAPAWLGLPVDPAATQGIEAEVLLGDDGVAQAVRLVHLSPTQENKKR